MRKTFTSPPSETQEDDLLPEYPFDYRHAKPNRFADEGARQKKGEPVGTKKIVRSAITGRFVKPFGREELTEDDRDWDGQDLTEEKEVASAGSRLRPQHLDRPLLQRAQAGRQPPRAYWTAKVAATLRRVMPRDLQQG